ncbi:MAG TPA: RNA methyltransferase [Longimicrobiales bacterium]
MFQHRDAPSRAESKLIRGLHRRKVRDAEGLFLAEGVRGVEDLVASGIPLRLAVVSPSAEEGDRGRALVRALGERTTVRRVADGEIAALAGTESPQGVLAVAEIPRWSLDAVQPGATATVLVLDGVQDPGNFGTLVRTADAFGVDLVAALPGTVDPWNPKAVRSAAGASFRIPVVQPSIDRLLAWLRGHGFGIYGAEAGGTDIGAVRIESRAALVVGNEGAGLSAAVRGAADALVAIPIAGHAESLNVAVAAGILLYLLTRRR